MKQVLAIALVMGTAYAGIARGQTATAIVRVQLQPTYGDKPYWSSRIYSNLNGTWQMAESYHTTIKDAPVMAPVPVSAAKPKSTN